MKVSLSEAGDWVTKDTLVSFHTSLSRPVQAGLLDSALESLHSSSQALLCVLI